MRAIGEFRDQKMVIKGDNKGIPNGRAISFKIGGRDGLETELGMNAKCHCNIGKEKEKRRGTYML